MRIRLTDDDGEREMDLEELLEVNEFDAWIVEAMNGLRLGQVFISGGGASCAWSVERIA